jgi:hypothetical protein
MEKKTYAKSIRYTKTVNDYIENYRGVGFNQKFENIILDAMEGEQERNRTLSALDETIAQRREKLRRISRYIYDLDRASSQLVRLKEACETLERTLSFTADASGPDHEP